jgi:ribosomal peptide maturation radical SAM protein 1
MRRAASEVVLISMPFGSPFRPSLGLSLLKAALTTRGISCQILYFGFLFADRIGRQAYIQISNGYPSPRDLLGDWIFSSALFDDSSNNPAQYVDQVLRGHDPAHAGTPGDPKDVSDDFVHRVLRARSQTNAFLEECRSRVQQLQPRVVGFTSMFQQHTAALALARRLKAAAPDVTIVFGGPNCEGDMGQELVQQFPWVDVVVSGEADAVFPVLVERTVRGDSLSDLPGAVCRDSKSPHPPPPPLRDMDGLPLPDYDDFFAQADPSYGPHLVFESSRGCWWGERHQCTFCGLNGLNMQFRGKSIPRAIDELVYLRERYHKDLVFATDNILNMRYFDGFFAELERRAPGLDLVYEVKANLKKVQLRQLRRAGVRQIQPGVESLSTPILANMHKGVTGLQNIQLLKWCQELGIAPSWNLLWGFPDEPPAEYQRMADLLPLISHLPPPSSSGPIRLDRFSPDFDHAAERGLTCVEPVPAYRYVFPLPKENVARLAYYFTYSYAEPRDPEAYTRPLREGLAAWRRAYASSTLFAVDEGERLLIWDLRPIARKRLTVLTGVSREVYLACDAIRGIRQLPVGADDALPPLVEQGLMIQEGVRYLSLAIQVGEYVPPREAIERITAELRDLAARLGPW